MRYHRNALANITIGGEPLFCGLGVLPGSHYQNWLRPDLERGKRPNWPRGGAGHHLPPSHGEFPGWPTLCGLSLSYWLER